MKKDNGIIYVRPDKAAGSEPKRRLETMAKKDGRSEASFVRWLINREWDKRDKD